MLPGRQVSVLVQRQWQALALALAPRGLWPKEEVVRLTWLKIYA